MAPGAENLIAPEHVKPQLQHVEIVFIVLDVEELSRLFRRLFLTRLTDSHAAGQLAFFGDLDGLRRREAFVAHLAPLKRKDWFV